VLCHWLSQGNFTRRLVIHYVRANYAEYLLSQKLICALRANASGTHREGIVREVVSNQADLRWNSQTGLRNTAETVGGQLVFSSSSLSNIIPPSEIQKYSAYILGCLTTLSILFCFRVPQNMLKLNWLFHINNGDSSCLMREALREFAPNLLDALDVFQRGSNSAILPIIESYCYSGMISVVSVVFP
jgi:hypothetical protein